MRQLTCGSLFAGIGGMDLGLERAGLEVKFQVEIDPWCQKVLAKHWSDVPKYGDIRDVCKHNLEWVDVLAGGFPCQPTSRAGKRMAQADERWLWPEYARLVRELRPRYVVVENPTGLLDGGISDVLRDLACCGYDAEWQVLPAAAFGASHIRERIFILAYPQREGLERGTGERLPRTRWTSIFPSCGCAEIGGQWESESGVGRVAYGVSRRVDRIRGLGNAIVPSVAEFVGKCIVKYEEGVLVGD